MADRPYHALSVIPDIDQKILEGISSGKSLKAVADEYGVSDTAILRRVQQYPDYKIRQRTGLELRMDAREQQLEAADSNVGVTRADRLLGHARWLAERCIPETYGPKQQITGKDGGPIQVQVVRFGQTYDAEQHDTQVIDNTSAASHKPEDTKP